MQDDPEYIESKAKMMDLSSNKKVKYLDLTVIHRNLIIGKVQVFAKDTSHGLSSEKLEYNLYKKHPRVLTRDPKTNKITYSPHPWCGTRTGIHLCCKS